MSYFYSMSCGKRLKTQNHEPRKAYKTIAKKITSSERWAPMRGPNVHSVGAGKMSRSWEPWVARKRRGSFKVVPKDEEHSLMHMQWW